MPQAKRSYDILKEDDRKKAIDAIIAYFDSERGEEIGVVAAGDLLDLFLHEAAQSVYNQGVEDAKGLLHKEMEGMDLELDLLKKQA